MKPLIGGPLNSTRLRFCGKCGLQLKKTETRCADDLCGEPVDK